MSGLTADIVGLIGSALMVIAYAYSNMVKTVDFVVFNLLNLVGSVMLGASLLVHFNLASFTLEVVWFAVSVLGLGKALMQKRAT